MKIRSRNIRASKLWRGLGLQCCFATGMSVARDVENGLSAGIGALLVCAVLTVDMDATRRGEFRLAGARAGPAINQFEVKDLQSAPGDFEFQSQNAFSSGQPRRRTIDNGGGDVIYDDNTVIRQREALEVQLGITDWFRVRVGIEYEQERLDDPATLADAGRFGDLQLDEVAFEGVVVFVKPKAEGVGLGLLVEYGLPVSGEAESQSELYIGPIVEAHSGAWTMIANLAFVKFFGGDAEHGDLDFVRDERWDFSYFLQGKYDVSRSVALALEAYGTFERIGDTGRRSDASMVFGDINQHRAGLVGYYTFFPDERISSTRGREESLLTNDDSDDEKELSVSIGAGVLFGLNEQTPDATYKLSLEVEY